MRRLYLLAVFVVGEAALLYLFFELFLRADESRVLSTLFWFAAAQLALLAVSMRVVELERDRGKSPQKIASEQLHRTHTITLWLGGMIYLARLGAGIRHVARSESSQGLIIELVLWTVGAGAVFYFLYLQPHLKRSRDQQ